MRRAVLAAFLLLSAVSAAHAGHHQFHATASAVGGHVDGVPQSAASLSLSSSGGEAVEKVVAYDRDGVRFDEAHSFVSGREEGDVAVTVSTVTLRNVNVRDVVHADEITGRVTCRHRRGEAEADITFEGSRIVNLTVGGRPVELPLDLDFFAQYPTFGALTRELPARRAQFQSKARQFAWKSDGSVPVASLDSIVGSLVANDGDGVDAGNVIRVPGFGTLYVGEMVVRPGARRLNMLRIVFDDAPERRGSPRRPSLSANDDEDDPPGPGGITFGDIEGNGSDIPP